MNTKRGKQEAFILRELISVLGASSALILLAAPLFGRNHSTTNATLCLSNLRVLTVAWQLYASDNSGKLVQNYHGGEAQGGSSADNPIKSPWANGWLDWGLSIDNTNSLLIRTSKYARLAPYISLPRNVH